MAKKTWLQQRSRYAQQHIDKWNYITDHLEGLVLDGAETLLESSEPFLPDTAQSFFDESVGSTLRESYPATDAIERYLIRHEQGEDAAAYRERKRLADYTPHFSSAAITLAGMAFRVEADAERRWNRLSVGGESLTGLGDPKDATTVIGQMWNAAGQYRERRGVPYENLFRLAALLLVAYRDQWVLVDGYRRDADGRVVAPPQIKLLAATDVLDWYESDGVMEWVKVRAAREMRTRPDEAPAAIDHYYIYYAEGYEVWREVEQDNGETEALLVQSMTPYGGPDNPSFRFWGDSARTQPILPIYRTSLPMPLLGWLMAKKANAIFNIENALDFQLWTSSFPKFFADVADANGNFDAELFKELIDSFKKGWSVLPGNGHRFATAPTEGAEIKKMVLSQKVKTFYETFFQSYYTSVERSATEMATAFASGPESFLTFLVETIDRMENAALWRLEQIAAPDNPAAWGGASIRRSTNFIPIDMPQEVDLLLQRTMPGGNVPMDAETALQLALRYLRTKGRLHLDVEAEGRMREAFEEAYSRRDEARDRMARVMPNAPDAPDEDEDEDDGSSTA